MTYTIEIPLPPKELKPNIRSHYMAKAKATKKYKEWACNACLICLSDLGIRPPELEAATVQVTYYNSTNRRLDPDNILSSMKAAFDGITKSGLISDDKYLTHLPVRQLKDAENPRVEIQITGELK